MGRWDFFDYTPSKPRPARGGIKAQSRRGSFGANWWGKRWIAALESLDIGARLGRGKSYARKGQVLSVAVERGAVTASVQGSRKVPYKVNIGLKAFVLPDWKRVAGLLAAEPILLAKMLAGELPGEIEQVLAGAGLSLFPERHDDLKTSCSCPDWSNPCKHVAAVYYILGEAFDQDPFLIFKLRGLDRQELFEILGNAPASDSPDATVASSTPFPEAIKAGASVKRGNRGRNAQATPAGLPGQVGQDQTNRTMLADQAERFERGGHAEHLQPAVQAAEPLAAALPTDPTAFWKGNPEPGDAPEALTEPEMLPASTLRETAAALPRQLGNFPFWQGCEPLLVVLEPLYKQVVDAGLALVLGGEKE